MEPIAVAVGLLTVSAVALATGCVWAMSAHRRAALERRLSGPAGHPGPGGLTVSAHPTDSARSAIAMIALLMAPLAALATPRHEAETSQLALQLTRAGFRGSHAAAIYAASRMIAAIAGLGTYLAIAAMRVDPLPLGPSLGAILFAVGYYAPSAWLARHTRERQTQIERGLPDALDLLVTCVEAGLGIDAALQRVAGEMASGYPVLSAELQLTFLEVNAGIRRVDAMRRLADRTGVKELKTLAATLNQTEAFGTSVADALRVQADGMRIRRMQRAEEKAATIPVKLSVPLVLFILPSLFAVILGPAAVNIVRTLAPVLQRHR
jgi:tight adherence protein C